MRRSILLATLLLPALGAAVAQDPQSAAHRDLWCGLAFDFAAGELPADATPHQQRVIPHYAKGAKMLLERAEGVYLAAGYSERRFAALRDALRQALPAEIGTADGPYSFEDCDALLRP